MIKRRLGNSGLEAAPLAFGGNVFGWTVDEATAFQLLDRFVSAGFSLVDTADMYSRWVPGNSGGESETIIGNWFKQSGRRDAVVLATKVGMDMGGDKKGLSPKYIVRAVEDSLKRLQTDHIDLYQSHMDDPETPLEETLETYARLIKQGKVRAIGASNYSAPRLAEALLVSEANGFPRYETLQPEYNLFDREAYESGVEALCLEKGLGVITYYSLASGFLSGKYRSETDLAKSARGKGIKKYLTPRGFHILDALDKVAAAHNTTPASVALAWLMARPSVTAPIVSATNLDQLETLLQSVTLVLDTDSLAMLNNAGA